MMGYKKLNFGTAGIPICTPKRNTLNGIKTVKALGLSAMELEFVQSVNINEVLAEDVRKTALANDVNLTCHGQYFINLNAKEAEKYHASIGRVLKAAHIANLCGAKSLTFHAGFYLKQEPRLVYDKIEGAMKKIVSELQDVGNPIRVSPETTGKGTQFGDVDELIQLAENVEQTGICVDFSHVYARSIGQMNKRSDFHDVLSKVESRLGPEQLDNMHIHLAGIEYGNKGERRHLLLEESEVNYKDLLRELKAFNVKGVLICESPNIEEDALLLKNFYDKL